MAERGDGGRRHDPGTRPRVIADVDWSNLQVATAFVLGAILGSVGTIRVMRAVLRTMEHRDKGEK